MSRELFPRRAREQARSYSGGVYLVQRLRARRSDRCFIERAKSVGEGIPMAAEELARLRALAQ